uniref:Uncharacterized protein n=1 Tax=Percolomonas cosmopolitus TaxID=63605 RepID=A0A7S1PFT9_9EUKA|mmetsp:Transcript_4385/g.16526  ORF Transcript_4385/g.16526 Transcript_4385/m.16526 type:complete len:418 (+) Transcript_4385:36-1289(+)
MAPPLACSAKAIVRCSFYLGSCSCFASRPLPRDCCRHAFVVANFSSHSRNTSSSADDFLQFINNQLVVEREASGNDSNQLSHSQRVALIKNASAEMLLKSSIHTSIRFSAAQRVKFASLLQCAASEESNFDTRLYVGLINRYMLHNKPQEITQDKKDMLRDWIKRNGLRAPTPREKNALMKQIGLNRTQLRQQLNFLREISGTVDDNAREVVTNWLLKNHYRSPTSEERDSLQVQTKLGRNQLNNLIFRTIEEPGELSDEVRDILKNWITEHNRHPTPSERDELQEKTGLSKPQLYAQVSNILRNTPTVGLHDNAQALANLRAWYDRYKRQPTPEERSVLERQTQFTSRQIYEQVRRWSDEKIKITPQMRLQVHEYLSNIGFASPSSQERDELQQLTGLGRAQINGLITSLRKKQGT